MMPSLWQGFCDYPLRIYSCGRCTQTDVFHHITARGMGGENIFCSDSDKRVFLDKMNETFERYSFFCYAFCLMDDHFYLCGQRLPLRVRSQAGAKTRPHNHVYNDRDKRMTLNIRRMLSNNSSVRVQRASV